LSGAKWTAAAVLKTQEAATAVAFSPLDPDNRFVHGQFYVPFTTAYLFIFRRRLAVGLETGQILIYTSLKDDVSEWKLDLTLDSR
jgi:elongator complex protein 2